MANTCDFIMKVKGERENIQTLFDWMTQNGITWMGRGATYAELSFDKEEKNVALIRGLCKWSVTEAMERDAVSMREHPEEWADAHSYRKYITLPEACNELNLEMEVYSAEDGRGFQEHKLFRNGIMEIDRCVKWHEEYDDDNDKWISVGGFVWKFEI